MHRERDFWATGTADHIISRCLWNVGFDTSRDAVLIRGGADFRHFVPVKSKCGPEARDALVEMYGSTNPRKFHTDGSDELKYACRILNFRGHTTTALGEWQNNGLIESDVGLTKSGVCASRAQVGLRSKAWPWTGR